MHSCKNIWIDSMKNLLKIIIMVLPYLLDWIDDRMRERKRKERQAKREKAQDDPGGAFADHFGGRVRPVEDRADNADTAPKTCS